MIVHEQDRGEAVRGLVPITLSGARIWLYISGGQLEYRYQIQRQMFYMRNAMRCPSSGVRASGRYINWEIDFARPCNYDLHI